MNITKELHQKIKLLHDFNYTELPNVLKCLHAKEKHYQKDEVIFNQGDRIKKIGIILSGSLQIYHYDFFGNKSIRTELEEGDTFGEVYALSNNIAIPLVVIATKDTHVLFIDVSDLFNPSSNLCKQQFIQSLLKEVVHKNLILSKKIEHLSKRSTREKLSSYLSSEATRSNSSTFTIPFNRQELADYLCVDRSALSNELSKLSKDGYIQFKKNKFTIIKNK